MSITVRSFLDDAIIPLVGSTVILAFISAVSAWPWSMVAAFVAMCTLSVVLYANIVRPAKRLKDLAHPVTAYFVIPSKAEHGCDSVRQDENYHLVKTITLPPRSEALVDLVLFPELHFISSEIYFGCEGGRDVKDRPYAIEYVNRFIEIGAGRVIKPESGSTHYIDKHHFYHVKDQARWSVHGARAIAFKVRTSSPGRYPVKTFYPGDAVEGVSDDLTNFVEDSPNTRMYCVRAEHKPFPCSVGIPPLPSIISTD